MTKKRIITLTICILLVTSLTALLAGCGVSFPKDNAKLIERASAEWQAAEDKTSIDTYKLKDLVFQIPAKIATQTKTLKIKLYGGELQIIRNVKGTASLSLELTGMNLELDDALKTFVPSGFHPENLKEVIVTSEITLLPDKMTMTSTIKNAQRVKQGLEPIITSEVVLDDDNYKRAYPAYKIHATQSVFGTVFSSGVIDQESKSYSYAIPQENVNDELFRIPKILIDSNGDMKVNDSGLTIHGALKEYFGSADIITVINSILTPSPLKVTAYLAKGEKNYYYKEMNGNYIASGAMTLETSEKIVDVLIKLFGFSNPAFSLTQGIVVNLSMSISSTMKINNITK